MAPEWHTPNFLMTDWWDYGNLVSTTMVQVMEVLCRIYQRLVESVAFQVQITWHYFSKMFPKEDSISPTIVIVLLYHQKWWGNTCSLIPNIFFSNQSTLKISGHKFHINGTDYVLFAGEMNTRLTDGKPGPARTGLYEGEATAPHSHYTQLGREAGLLPTA